MIIEDLTLKLRISVSDKDVKTAIGSEKFEELFDEALDSTRGACFGCGYRPLDDSKTKSVISFHVVEYNPETLEVVSGIPLCRACHMTQHVDIAIEKDWIEVVNSTFSQKSLIELCRINAIHNNVNHENTRKLKATPKEYLETLKNNTNFPGSKTKAIFTSAFSWGDL